MAFMTYWQFQKCLRTQNNMIDCRKNLDTAVGWLLRRMYELCAEHGLTKKLSKKQLDDLYFAFREDLFDESLLLTDISYDFGEVYTEDLPTSWLWKKNWEQEFIKGWIEPNKANQAKAEKTIEDHEYKEYKRLKKKFSRREGER